MKFTSWYVLHPLPLEGSLMDMIRRNCSLVGYHLGSAEHVMKWLDQNYFLICTTSQHFFLCGVFILTYSFSLLTLARVTSSVCIIISSLVSSFCDPGINFKCSAYMSVLPKVIFNIKMFSQRKDNSIYILNSTNSLFASVTSQWFFFNFLIKSSPAIAYDARSLLLQLSVRYSGFSGSSSSNTAWSRKI